MNFLSDTTTYYFCMFKNRTLFFLFINLFTACSMEQTGRNVQEKDLSQQMDAMKALQEATGEELKANNTQEALEMLNGLDSIFIIACKDFEYHWRLNKSFKSYYDTKLKKTVTALKNALLQNDTIKANQKYILLVKRCNSCHIDNDVLENAQY